MEITPEVQELLDKQKAELESQFSSKFEQETQGLKSKVDELLGEKKAAAAKAQQAAEEAEQARLEKARSSKDVEAIENSWQEKYSGLEQQYSSLQNEIRAGKRNEIASKFVSEHVIDDPFSRDAMAREYASRIDIEGDKVRVLDAAGNPSALSVEDLNKEFMTASKYANHIKVTNSSGLGARSSNGVSGGAANPDPKQARIDSINAKFKTA